MELNITGNILLVGEANFSFTLSLINYCDPSCVTTSCYESRDEAIRKYGAEIVTSNIDKLASRNLSNVLYGIDACNLIDHFAARPFNRVIFMFPHVGGKSNLKKNRALVDQFFRSTLQVLNFNVDQFDLFKSSRCSDDSDSAYVFITLAKGQGGTRFEEDPAKRDNKDSWIVNDLANRNGYVLTDCTPLDEQKFPIYKSTGFRSQGKSFQTKSGLVHRFEPSLPIDFSTQTDVENQNLVNLEARFNKLNDFFIKNDSDYSSKDRNNNLSEFIVHPFVEFKHLYCSKLARALQTNLNLIEDNPTFTKSTDGIRTSLIDSMDQLEAKNLLKVDAINCLAGLVLSLPLKKQPVLKSLDLVEDFKFELMIVASSLSIINEALQLAGEFGNKQPQIRFIRHAESRTHVTAVIEFTGFFTNFYELTDSRLLFSNDKRSYYRTVNGDPFTYGVRAFAVERCQWQHDVSFWVEKNSFDYRDFLDTVRDSCAVLVRHIQLIDEYNESDRTAFCFRLFYESCDRALSWSTTTQVQYFLRDRLAARNKFVLR
jgi:hypothetical protein